MSDEKKPYEVAVDTYLVADAKYKEAEEKLLSGSIIEELIGQPADKMKLYYQQFVQKVRDLLEDRNVKLRQAQDALRAAVTLTETQWRGPDGHPDTIQYGGMKVSSVTKRTFDASTLFRLLNEKSVELGKPFVDLLLQERVSSPTGEKVPIMEEVWHVNYEAVLGWLRATGLGSLVNGAYDEKESTPQVSGAKPLSFLGDKKDR